MFLKFLLRQNLGLEPKEHDERDLGFWNIFGIGYKPKYEKKLLKPLTCKKQVYNTCGWNASTGAKEIDEKIELDERTMVILGKHMKYINGDGYSTLRNNEKILKRFGIAEKGFLKSSFNNWDQYSNTKLLNGELLSNAKKHCSKVYFSITNFNEIYQAIDRGRPVKIGVDWYTKLNMTGSFKYPWIYKLLGWLVGGHAMYVYGYNLNYKGQRVFIVRNSFGRYYGDNGDLYIIEKDLQKQINKYGAYVNEDMDADLAKWLIRHQGNIVKDNKNSDVYLIQGNKKRKYVDEATLVAHGKSISDIIIVNSEYLESVKKGDDILFWDGGNVKQIKEMIRQHKNLKEIYKKYFNELYG